MTNPKQSRPNLFEMSGQEKTRLQQFIVAPFAPILANFIELVTEKLAVNTPAPEDFVSMVYAVDDGVLHPEGCYMTITVFRGYAFDKTPGAVQQPLTANLYFHNAVTGNKFGLQHRSDTADGVVATLGIVDQLFPGFFYGRVQALAKAQLTALAGITDLPDEAILADSSAWVGPAAISAIPHFNDLPSGQPS